MYLFSRSARLAPGNLQKSMTWAAEITEKVNQITEFDAHLWTTVFSPAEGTLVWTTLVENLAVLEASSAKMIADPGYISLVDSGAELASGDPIDDGLLQIVFADPASADVHAQYATVVQAVLAPGNAVRGVELGVEIAQKAGGIMRTPTSFGVATTGTYGAVEWISVYDSVEKLEQGQQALAADAAFGELLDKEGSKAYMANAIQSTFRHIM